LKAFQGKNRYTISGIVPQGFQPMEGPALNHWNKPNIAGFSFHDGIETLKIIRGPD